MNRSTKRIVSILLVICMCAAILPGILPEAKALTLGYTPSSAYRSSSYYSAVLDVTLTGDQREDIINVALSQVGYVEGSSSGDFGGAKDGSYVNYTEYNYWYHNHVSSGMPVGGSYAHWCATFVSWCAEQAGVPTSILKRSTAAGHSYSYFNLNFYSGSSTLASSSDNDSYFMGYNYSPKKGDLFFTRSWSHVGLVVSSDGTYVTTVEGNTNNDGSADGYGVFVRTRRIADLYFGTPEYEDNSVKDYASSCTYYPAHCKITIDSDTPINSQPRSVSTEDDSVTIGDAVAGQTYTATALYRNGFGNYWYRVETGSGETGYVYSGDASYVEQITTDITLTGYAAPDAHVRGNSFGISGTIASDYNRLDTAACYIYSGFGRDGEVVTGASDTVSGNKYVLGGSDVDYGTAFGVLENGNHTYVISVSYTNYYAANSTTAASNTGTICLLSEYFVVIPSGVSQSSCSHSYTTTTIHSASCTQSGTAVKACSNCGLVSTTTVAAGGHSYGSWVTVDATCTAAGSKSRTCTVCGNVETQSISAGGHDYSMVTHNATCQSYARYEYTCANCGDHYDLDAGEMASGWLDYLPAGLDSSLFNSKTQYRYSDYQTAASYETSMPGYTLKSSQWEKSGTKTVNYVNSWPSGFSTSSSLYTEYDNKSSKVSASESVTSKTTVDSDEIVGYLYYHWCYTDSYYSVASSSGSYTTFHAYYSTTTPDSYTCDPTDDSYRTAHSCCSNSDWFFVTEVYGQASTSYNKLFTYERWTDYSDWSDTAVTANDTRRVESRSVYQLKSASLGDHAWRDGVCSVCGAEDPDYVVPMTKPTLSLVAPTLNFKDEIYYNIYYTVSDMTDVVEMGLITFDTSNPNGTIADADAVISGYVRSGTQYMSHTNGIRAKMLGDALYFKAYAKLSDGSYAYSSMAGYHAVAYAKDILANSTNARMKALVVAMLNYGAAAQIHFNYKTDALVNSFLTEEQQALVRPYSAGMVGALTSVDKNKVGAFVMTANSWTYAAPSVVFDGAFAINYYFTPAKAVSGEMTLYIWDEAAYSAASVLTTTGATDKVTMTLTDAGTYLGSIDGIAAKNIDGVYYVAAVYYSNGTVCCTGVIPYSLGTYCVDRIQNGSGTMPAFAEATAVYGYYAKCYFA